MNCQPLQTHGLTRVTQVWHPPRSNNRFWTSDKSDEHWMRPLVRPGDDGRYGRIQKIEELEPLFDVRDSTNHFVGYTDQDPRWPLSRRSDSILYPVLDGERYPETYEKPKQVRDPSSFPIQDEARFRDIVIRVRDWRLRDYPGNFIFWVCDVCDAADLVRSGFIKLHGEDNFHDFVHQTMMNSADRYFDQRKGQFGR